MSVVNYTKTGRVSKAKKGLNLYECDCGRSYSRLEHLQRHQKNHGQGDALVCNETECGRIFYRQDLHERHQESHNDIEESISHTGLSAQALPKALPASLPVYADNEAGLDIATHRTMDLPAESVESGIPPPVKDRNPITWLNDEIFVLDNGGINAVTMWSEIYDHPWSIYSRDKSQNKRPQVLQDTRRELTILTELPHKDDQTLEAVMLPDAQQNDVQVALDQQEEALLVHKPWEDHLTSDETGSVISDTGSVFSERTAASSMSDYSMGGRFTYHQIATATEEFLKIFQTHDSLVQLYNVALELPNIGAERLQRNMRRLLNTYAKNLQSEANKELETLMSRLVARKGPYVAQAIIEKFETQPMRPSHVHRRTEDSSDEEEGEPVDEDLIQDLVAFRRFLIEGNAFELFQRQLKSFVLPESDDSYVDTAMDTSVNNENHLSSPRNPEFATDTEISGPKGERRLFGGIRGIFSKVLVVAGYLEPPLERGRVRLRWNCKCGGSFWSDVMEYRQGGVSQVVERVRECTGAEVSITSYNGSSTNQKWTFNTSVWRQKVTKCFTSGSNDPPPLPLHSSPNQSAATTTTTAGYGTTTGADTLHLLACVHATHERKSLLQEPVDKINNDRSLFRFMKHQLQHKRKQFWCVLSLRSVQGIYFLKVHLHADNMVEVREHKSSCHSPQSCYCFPPDEKREPSPNTEYRCKTTIAAWPPVDPRYMLHMVNSPGCVSEKGTSILNILPRRICGKLVEGLTEPAEGWGIYYQEGLDADMVVSVLFSIFLVGSLLFGVLWSALKMDIQGAFGVSSYMMTASGIVIAWVATRAKNYG